MFKSHHIAITGTFLQASSNGWELDTAAELEPNSLPLLKCLELGESGKPSAICSPDRFVSVESIIMINLDGAFASRGSSSLSHQLDLARLLQSDEKVNRCFNATGRDEQAVVLGDVLDCDTSEMCELSLPARSQPIRMQALVMIIWG